MNGQIFTPDTVVKNLDKNRFEQKPADASGRLAPSQIPPDRFTK
jgi:hypothetical protein